MKKRSKSKSKKFRITVIVDTNDADYNTKVSTISESDLEKIKPLISAIKNFKPYTTPLPKQRTPGSLDEWKHYHNYPVGECLREDLGEKSPREKYDFPEKIFDIFDELLPCTEYGFHTIESIEVTPFTKKIKLL